MDQVSGSSRHLPAGIVWQQHRSAAARLAAGPESFSSWLSSLSGANDEDAPHGGTGCLFLAGANRAND